MAAPPPQKPFAGPQDASGRARNAGDELLDECAALEDEVEELKAKYEMYFLGVELREPNRWREEVRRKVLRIKEKFTRNTGLRFRIQSLHARFISYERLWMRSAREREEGTYRRDLFKAKRHARGPLAPAAGAPATRAGAGPGPAGAKRPPAHEHHEGEDVDLSDLGADLGDVRPAPKPASPAPAPARTAVAAPPPGMFPLPGARPAPAAPAAAAAPRPAAPSPARPAAPVPAAPGQAAAAPAPPPPAARPAAPAPPPAGGARVADKQMRELYDAYITAKRRCNEDTSRLTFDAVASSVSRQIPEIMRQHNARSVEFKVVIKDGKAKLTAVPKS